MVSHLTTESSCRRFPVPSLLKLLRAIRALLTRSTDTLAPDRDQIDQGVSGNDQHLTAADKRRYPRINLTETTVQVTDGCLFATALIDNISLCGICLRNLPEQLYRGARQLTVFSNNNPGIPILHIQPEWETSGWDLVTASAFSLNSGHIQPEWETSGWDGKTIGASILNTSETWKLFFVRTAGRMEV